MKKWNSQKRLTWIDLSVLKKRWKSKEIRLHPHCWYCNRQLTEKSATIDHIVPLSAGGWDVKHNFALACIGCNQKKGKRQLVDAGMTLKFKRKK